MTLLTQTDAEVFLVLKAGNLSALGILYDRYGELVYRLALKMLSNAQEAEDLTQEVFLQLWQGSTYDSQRGSMSNFLLMITRSRATDRLRSRRSRLHLYQRWHHSTTTTSMLPTPIEQASTSELTSRVRDALLELPETQRQVLEMAYFNGLSQSEIAQHLNIPLGTVKTRARQGLLKLRQKLQDLVD